MTPQLVMAAVLVLGGGLVATVSGLAWDLRLQRRDRRPDVGLSILRSAADDASPAEVLGLSAAIRHADLYIAPSPKIRERLRPAWDAPTSELPVVALLPYWPAVAPPLPAPWQIRTRAPQRWMRWPQRYVQPELEVAR